jgi:hypothetical protein
MQQPWMANVQRVVGRLVGLPARQIIIHQQFEKLSIGMMAVLSDEPQQSQKSPYPGMHQAAQS